MNNLLKLLLVSGLSACAVLIGALGMAQSAANLLAPARLLIFLIAAALYFLPATLAYRRNCEAAVWIALVDVLLGWTIFGWFIAIGWAAGGKVQSLTPTIASPADKVLHSH